MRNQGKSNRGVGNSRSFLALPLVLWSLVNGVVSLPGSVADLGHRFAETVRPFLENYCLDCHDQETRKADLDLAAFRSLETVVNDQAHWELVLERLREGDMPPQKAKPPPSLEARQDVIAWIETLREQETQKQAGNPGPVPARRLSNAE